MKKIGSIFLFLFMTGLFAGLFFSTTLSPSSSADLSVLLHAGFTNDSEGFFSTFFAIFLCSLIPMLLMLPAAAAKCLCFLPPAILWFKSFSIGFCTGLVYINQSEQAILLTLTRILPQSLCLIPAFLILSAAVFHYSVTRSQKNRTPHEYQVLSHMLMLAAALLLLGSLLQTLFCRVPLS